MSRKTNKTSHVMDLLTNGASAESDATVNEAVAGQEKKSADVQSHTVTPAKVTVVDEGSRNDRLSQEILGKLTEELEEETRQELESQETDAQNAQKPKEEPRPQPLESEDQNPEPADAKDPLEVLPQLSEDASETMLPEEESPASASVPDKKPDQAPPRESKQINESPKKESHPIIPESQLDNRFQDKEYRFINVMEQLLMRQNLDAVLRQYEVCTCPRCMSDVCALALTGLPSKYVVTSRDSISPLISYYENKYKIPVLTELMKACNKVRQNPRHKVSASS